MMKDGIKVDEKHGVLVGHYDSFNTLFTLHTPYKLVTALSKIEQKLQKDYHSTKVFFEISRGR